MLYGAEVAVCSDINTKHINKVWTECHFLSFEPVVAHNYVGADKSLVRPTCRCILFDGENISFDASLVIYINSTNIPPIMIINTIYENRNILSL
jgi:hypothetical protein